MIKYKFGIVSKILDKVYSLKLDNLIYLIFGNILLFAFISGYIVSNTENHAYIGDSLIDKTASLLYYSSAIFTNTGVGDISHQNNYLKIISIIQMILGVFLFSFVIAKLTSRKSDEVINNLVELELDLNYKSLIEELYVIRRRLDAIYERALKNNKAVDEDLVLLSLTISELNSSFIIAPKLLNSIGDDSLLDRNRQELLTAMIRRTVIRLYETLMKFNKSKFFWLNNRNLEKILECIILHRKYHNQISKNHFSFSKYLLADIEESKKYSEFLEEAIERARINSIDKN